MPQKTTNNLLQSDTKLSFLTPLALINTIVLTFQGHCSNDIAKHY